LKKKPSSLGFFIELKKQRVIVESATENSLSKSYQ